MNRQLQRAILKFMTRLANPDDVGSTEYRAVYESLYDFLTDSQVDTVLLNSDQDPLKHMLAMCDEFVSAAKGIKKQLRKKSK